MFEHTNRQAVRDGVVHIIHQSTADQRTDILTKPLGPLQYIYQRSILMNHTTRTVFNPIITRKSLILSFLFIFFTKFIYPIINLTRAYYMYTVRTYFNIMLCILYVQTTNTHFHSQRCASSSKFHTTRYSTVHTICPLCNFLLIDVNTIY